MTGLLLFRTMLTAILDLCWENSWFFSGLIYGYQNKLQSETILLTGGLYQLNESREKRTIPVFNADARVVGQHSVEDFNNLPKPPEYLD